MADEEIFLLFPPINCWERAEIGGKQSSLDIAVLSPNRFTAPVRLRPLAVGICSDIKQYRPGGARPLAHSDLTPLLHSDRSFTITAPTYYKVTKSSVYNYWFDPFSSTQLKTIPFSYKLKLKLVHLPNI